jgi:hypothetical protein
MSLIPLAPFQLSETAVLPLSAGSELVVLVFEQDVERGQRSVTARDILVQVEFVGIAQFVARVHLLLENSPHDVDGFTVLAQLEIQGVALGSPPQSGGEDAHAETA